MMQPATLTAAELREITGYAQPARQLAELRLQGYWRARLGRLGVVLERPHFEAVSQGIAGKPEAARPRVRV